MNSPQKILVIDIGGTNVKVLATGIEKPIKIPSGKDLTPERMVSEVIEATKSWEYDVISIGYPGVVKKGKVAKEPVNLSSGWKEFDFAKAFGKPIKLINDAAMQALGSYEGGRMLFLGMGTGLGTALIDEGVVISMEGGHLPYRKGKSLEDFVGKDGYEKMGAQKWSKHVLRIIKKFDTVFHPDDIVIGGGNGGEIGKLPENTRLGSNANAFEGGFRLWRES